VTAFDSGMRIKLLPSRMSGSHLKSTGDLRERGFCKGGENRASFSFEKENLQDGLAECVADMRQREGKDENGKKQIFPKGLAGKPGVGGGGLEL